VLNEFETDLAELQDRVSLRRHQQHQQAVGGAEQET
jgi:hypothetical protein